MSPPAANTPGDAELPALKSAPFQREWKPPLTALWLFLVGFFVIESFLRFLPEGSMTRTLRHRSEEILYLPPTRIQFMGDSATNALQVPLLKKFIGGGHELSNYALPGTTPLFATSSSNGKSPPVVRRR